MITVRFLAGPDVEADERSDPGALAATELRAHVKADASADACGDDSDVRHPCREINARAPPPASRLRGARDPQNSDRNA